MNSPLSKTALRQSLRQARDRFVRGLAPAERGSLQQEAARRLEAVLGDGAWASYVAIGSEIDPSPLATLAAPGRVIAYPWFENRDAPMIFRSGQGSLQPGPFGISQPDAGNPSVTPQWIIVPLVGVDRQGNRIGQGAGHYDRALQSLRADGSPRTIGLAWDVQLVESVPADPWDQPLDYVITPSRTIEIRP